MPGSTPGMMPPYPTTSYPPTTSGFGGYSPYPPSFPSFPTPYPPYTGTGFPTPGTGTIKDEHIR